MCLAYNYHHFACNYIGDLQMDRIVVIVQNDVLH